jgi:hypothetical protein
LKLYLSIIILFLAKFTLAQIPCIDEFRITPTYQCNDQFYLPVCGCNGLTYRNQCNAYYVHGVNNWVSGVCAGIDVDFYPNPVVQNTNLTINLAFPDNVMANADVKIVDMYGKVWTQRIVNNFNKIQIEFDMSVVRTGVYVLVVQASNNTGVTKLFAKY